MAISYLQVFKIEGQTPFNDVYHPHEIDLEHVQDNISRAIEL